jgi:CBS domain containing-hemolysin-like protein
MKTGPNSHLTLSARRPGGAILCLTLLGFTLHAPSAHASLFHGETLDAVANALSWVVLIVVPVVAIAAFWIVHILPEKIAEKKHHPQAHAIQCLCLLSLFFGGILWPLAWIWAYTKPVLHKMAYGTDTDMSHKAVVEQNYEDGAVDETARLRARVTELEAQLSRTGVV